MRSEKLKTQDKLKAWEVHKDVEDILCPLFQLVPASHSHLFFKSSFASQVWSKINQ